MKRIMSLLVITTSLLISCNNNEYSSTEIQSIKKSQAEANQYLSLLQEATNSITQNEKVIQQKRSNGEPVLDFVQSLYNIDDKEHSTLGVVLKEDGPYRIIGVITSYSINHVVYSAIIKTHYDNISTAEIKQYGLCFIIIGDEEIIKFLGTSVYYNY